MFKEATGTEPSKKEVKAMMDLVDEDGSGEINFEEFCKVWEMAQSGEIKCQAFKNLMTTWNDGKVTSVKVTGLKNGCRYRFTVRAENAVGQSYESKPSNAVKIDAPLPDGWVEQKDPTTGEYFFCNHKTKQCLWHRPDADPWFIPTDLFLKISPGEFEAFKRMYTTCDADKNGAITRDELAEVLPLAGENLVPNDIDYLMFKGDEDESGELDFQEFAHLLDLLKTERQKHASVATRVYRVCAAFKEWCTRPKVNKKYMHQDEQKKMGPWEKHNHPIVGKPYYFNTVTNETCWDMPNQVRFYYSEELGDMLNKTFNKDDFNRFEEKFTAMDLDNSGAIDKDELRLILKSMGERITEGRLKGLMQEVDTDGSGEIDFDEFLLMMHAVQGGKMSAGMGRLVGKISDSTPQVFNNMVDSYEKFKRKAGVGKGRYPHGLYCLCGCRADLPASWLSLCLPKRRYFPRVDHKLQRKIRRQRDLAEAYAAAARLSAGASVGNGAKGGDDDDDD